jgi:hypothetical protein
MREPFALIQPATGGAAAPAEALSVRSGTTQPGVNPLLNARTLELGNRAEHPRNKPPSGTRVSGSATRSGRTAAPFSN